jgi:microcompartment protein CcmK/EutM
MLYGENEATIGINGLLGKKLLIVQVIKKKTNNIKEIILGLKKKIRIFLIINNSIYKENK